MDREAQNVYLSKWYMEVNRYMDNAKDALKKAEKQDDGYYKDRKYVETACGVAYLAVLRAVDAWLAIKDVPELGKKKHKSIDYYMFNVSERDQKLASTLNSAYNVLHLGGYYRGETRIKTIETGFEAAYEIIEKIKPERLVEVKETKGQGLKRALNNLLISAAVMFK
jgi:hypothetical protein